MKNQIGNSGLKIIEGRHQQGPRFEARTFVPEVIYEHRVKYKHHIIYLWDQSLFRFSQKKNGTKGQNRSFFLKRLEKWEKIR